MSYLMIRNKGVVDIRSLTMLGASNTRFANRQGTIGMFGSGSKYAIAMFLRYGYTVVICAGNLKAEFFPKEEIIQGQKFRRVCVKLSGKELDGKSVNRTEELGFALEWGTQDWTSIDMGLREFISNAIDGSIASGRGHNDVEFEWVPEPRAKADHTTVYINASPELRESHTRMVKQFFLHFANPSLLNKHFLPKGQEQQTTLIFKKGVQACYLRADSVFNYNFGDELKLSESRIARESDIQEVLGRVLSEASVADLKALLIGMAGNPKAWEHHLYSYCLPIGMFTVGNFRAAFLEAFGPKGVLLSTDLPHISEALRKRGFTPVVFGASFTNLLKKVGIRTESAVLNKNETSGREVGHASIEMDFSLTKVWNMLQSFGLTNGKPKPMVASFYTIMKDEAQTWGYYMEGGDTVYLHRDLKSGPHLDKVTLEEVAHYVTGADDNSRDFQDFFLRVITAIAF